MKRLFAILLAILLPMCAVAETYQLSLGMQLDEAMISQLAALPGNDADPRKTELMIKIAQYVLDGASVKVTVQDDAARIDIGISGGSLLDMTIYTEGDMAYVTSSLIPGKALTYEVVGTSEEEPDLTGVMNAVTTLLESRMTANPGVITTGSFTGDAYTGGTRCTTWYFSDKDIADLISELMTGEASQAVLSCLTAMGFEPEKLSEIAAANDAVAQENQYAYIFRKVENDAGDVIGLSFTIIHEDTQVATLSLGAEKDGMRGVLGIGMPDQNYWWEFTLEAGDLQGRTSYGGISREWTSDKRNSFAYVAANEEPTLDTKWYCNVRKVGNRYLWDAGVYDAVDQVLMDYLFTSTGSVNPSTGLLDSEFTLSSIMTLSIDLGPVKAIPPMPADLACYSLTDPAMEKQTGKVLDLFASAIAARMIKLLPMDLILLLSAPAIP